MDCWEILGIEPDSDKKTIKIAYAKLLKKHRPDDDPEGFQRLHTAYKNALKWEPVEFTKNETPWMTDEGVNHSLDEETSDIVLRAEQFHEPEEWLSDKPELTPEDQALLSEIDEQEAHLGKDWETLHRKVNQIIKLNSQVNDVKAWQFIEALPSMQDLEFRKAAADNIFEAVSELNSVSLEQKSLYIKRPVLNYLNGLFSWDKKWQQYEYEYPRERLDAVFPYFAEAERPVKGAGQKRELHYYRRGAAFAIDVLILFAVALVIDRVATDIGGEEAKRAALGWWALIYVLFLVPIQESSKYQGTVGKRIMGLQLISARGDRVNFFHALWRSVVTAFCCLIFKVVVFINIILSWWRSELLQDTLTGSYVILKPGAS